MPLFDPSAPWLCNIIFPRQPKHRTRRDLQGLLFGLRIETQDMGAKHEKYKLGVRRVQVNNIAEFD